VVGLRRARGGGEAAAGPPWRALAGCLLWLSLPLLVSTPPSLPPWDPYLIFLLPAPLPFVRLGFARLGRGVAVPPLAVGPGLARGGGGVGLGGVHGHGAHGGGGHDLRGAGRLPARRGRDGAAAGRRRADRAGQPARAGRAGWDRRSAAGLALPDPGRAPAAL